jgi:rhamnosyltransferase
MRVFSDVGLMREGFFVDYVDTEWGLRAKTIGLDICGVFSVQMQYRMGLSVNGCNMR